MTKNHSIQSHNFTKSLKRLEAIVEQLEDPELDLEEGLKLLEEGVKLHKLCREKLTEANTRITTILGKDQTVQKATSESEVNKDV